MVSACHGLAFESFGLVAEVVTGDQELLDRVPAVLPPGWRQTDRANPNASFGLMRNGTITLDGDAVAKSEGDSDALLALFASVLRSHVALHAPAHVFIHAGVAALGGKAIVIPGSSYSGKTMLVAALVRSGATYYSDEYAVVDADGLIHPYAAKLSIRTDPGSPPVPAPDPAAPTGSAPIRAALIVVTSYAANSVWRPKTCTPGEGALALLQHTIAVRSRPAAALAAAQSLARSARVIAGPRGEASVAADALLGSLQAELPGSAS